MIDRLDVDTEKPNEEEIAKRFGWEDDYYSGNLSWWQRLKPQVWSLFDEPWSSTYARVSSPCSMRMRRTASLLDPYTRKSS